MTGGGKTAPRFPSWLTASPDRVARRGVRAIRNNHGLVVCTATAQVVWWTKRLAPNLIDRIQRFRRVRSPAMPEPGLPTIDRIAISDDQAGRAA